MKPAPFDYRAPRTLEEALSLLAEHGSEAKILAGGQSLIPMLNFRLAQPALLVDGNRLPGLDAVETTAQGGLRLGAFTRQRELERHDLIAARAPLLRRAVPWIAHPQIRNRGTVGGSLAHGDPASELPAVMVALDARFELTRLGSCRWVSAKDFFVGLLTTALEEDEILTAVEIPPPPGHTGWAFQEVARRLGDYAQVGLAARLTLGQDGRCQKVRLVFLSVGDGPVEVTGATDLLVGEAPGEAAFSAAAEAAAKGIEPTSDIHASADFKHHLAQVLVRRCLHEAAAEASLAGATGGGPG